MVKITLSIMFGLILVACLSSCSSQKNTDDYRNSLSVKKFLFENNYVISIDGIIVSKYTEEEKIKCDVESILELSNGDILVSEMILPDDKNWHKFADNSIYVKLFSGG